MQQPRPSNEDRGAGNGDCESPITWPLTVPEDSPGHRRRSMTRNHSTPEPPLDDAACATAQKQLDDRALHFWCERCGERSRYVEQIDGVAYHPSCRDIVESGLYPNDPACTGSSNFVGFMRARNARLVLGGAS